MESIDYLRNLLLASPRIYGKTNHRTEHGRHLSVYVVVRGNIEDITALIARCSTRVLTPKGLYVNGTGHCHIQAISEELTTLFKFQVQYEQLVSNYS
jgi:hypothetical protein